VEIGQGRRLAHRVVWQCYEEPLKGGQILHHQCENRRCAKPKKCLEESHLPMRGCALRRAKKCRNERVNMPSTHLRRLAGGIEGARYCLRKGGRWALGPTKQALVLPFSEERLWPDDLLPSETRKLVDGFSMGAHAGSDAGMRTNGSRVRSPGQNN
jgi:hypothetical protein